MASGFDVDVHTSALPQIIVVAGAQWQARRPRSRRSDLVGVVTVVFTMNINERDRTVDVAL